MWDKDKQVNPINQSIFDSLILIKLLRSPYTIKIKSN